MESVDAPTLLATILDDALNRRASDVHLEPVAEGYEIRFRIDGLLELQQRLSASAGRAVVNRLMVLGQLLTYRLDVPQEGRITHLSSARSPLIDFRLAMIPTSHGLRCAIRLPAELTAPHTLEQLGHPASVLGDLYDFAKTDSGMLLVVGPAGSGKTTTIYALLEHIARVTPGLSIIALEDPIERHVTGITQIEVKPFGELTYERALRSILRQDPQILMLGEIRDCATATLAIQAALSGHRLISTLHAPDSGGAIARLLEMGIEPYQIASSLFGVLSQRLLRRTTGPDKYQGRVPVSELVRIDASLRSAILARADARTMRDAYARPARAGSIQQAARQLIDSHITDETEVRRIFSDFEH